MNPLRLTSLPLLLPFLGALGCAERPAAFPPSVPAVVFPTRAEVARIPAKSALPAVFGTGAVAVDTWTVESPPLSSDGPYDDPSAWGSLLRDLTKTRGESVTLSPAMRCAAAEIGRFHLKNKALPVERLRRFILARCGGDATNVAPIVWFVEAPAGVSDEQIASRARDALANAIEEPLAHGHHLVGLAAARDGKRASVVIAIAQDEARLEPGPRSIGVDRKVTLRGTARGEYAQVVALANRGDFGISRCVGDPRVRLPQFALTCAVAPGDSFAWVEVLGQMQGRVMLHPLAEVLVYEGDGSSVRYAPKAYGPPAPVTDAPELTSALVDRINGVRAAAKIPALTLAPKQSAENARLVGTLLDATLSRDDDSAEKAAIGLMAGWEVEGGTIRDGQFFLNAVAPTHDAMAWLESAVDRPIGRLTLLDPDARRIAVGPSVSEGASGIGAVVTTYALFESEDHAADEALFLARIKDARASRGLEAATRVPSSEAVQQLAARVRQEAITPQGALNEMLASVAASSGASTYGYVFEATDLTNIEIPSALLKPGAMPVMLSITHHRAPGAAWGQYVIFALLVNGL